MKVNLLINGYPLNGYLNLDPIAQPGEVSGRINHGLENLDDIVDNNECTEFLANGIIDSFPIGAREQALRHWLSKLEHEGIFVVSGLDINKAARLIASGDMKIQDVNLMLYGPCNSMWSINKGAWSINDAINVILSVGQFKIVSKSFRGPNYIIKAQRI